ncbi:CHAT domain-containing protein [Aquimarina sp. MMG016]|uniref:CHAT domain-containing protein n=1 Tax=Aquimarina sp. MMG016 TaxID=2822690 RepID=UPI001B3A67EB|nr:CHAT domain-containing protein [Aquimarina sp. MMG016]MBQ4822252.1 CHAT domain-containing protein [Aquimarina sp. MMG016]
MNLYLFLLVLLASSDPILSQTKYKGSEPFLSILNSKKEHRDIDKSIDSIFNTYTRPEQDSLLAVELHEYGKWWYKKDLDKAITYTKKALDIRQKLKSSNFNSYTLTLNNLAIFYYIKGDVINSIKHYNQFVTITKDLTRKRSAYWRLALNYWKIRDYPNSLSALDQLELLSIELNEPKWLLLCYLQAAKVHFNLGDTKNCEEGIKKALKADSIIPMLDKVSDDNKFQTYSILGSLYKKKGNDTLNALKYYNKIIQSGDNGEWIGRTYFDIQGLKKNKEIDTSLFYLNNALKHIENNNTLKALVSHNKAWAYFRNNNFLQAIEHSNSALLQIAPGIKINGYKTILPNDNELQINPKKNTFLKILKDNVKFAQKLYEKNKDISILKNSLNISTLGDKLVDIIRLESNAQQSNLFWKNDASDLYLDAVKTCYVLNKPEKALYFIEKNKALLLLEDISNEELRRVNIIPDSILAREFLLKREIADTQNKLNNKNHKSITDSIKLELFNAKQKYSAFVDSLEISYPQYYSSKRTADIISLDQVQKYSNHNNYSFIHYILGNKTGYGLIINQNTTDFFEIEDVETLQKDIKTFGKLVSQPLHSKKEFESFKTVSKRIYNTLIPKKTRSYITEKVTIISDHNLYNIPFEALLDNNNHYLIESYEINYAYSISFLLQNKKLKRNSEKEFLGFAPVQYTFDLPVLENTKTEIDQIALGFDSTVLLNEQASKQNLIDELSRHKIIHLSTHANANDSIIPWIAGVNNKITLNDIYATKNNAELVVLSACNTSIGTIEKGEGVMSLARGFFNTGSNSVISTLWKADDKTTVEVTTNFYKQLKKGKTKSEALRIAKLDYLKNHSMRKASPYYWSLLVLIGDPEPIYTSFNYWLIIPILLCLFIILLLFRKRMKQNKS